MGYWIELIETARYTEGGEPPTYGCRRQGRALETTKSMTHIQNDIPWCLPLPTGGFGGVLTHEAS